VKTIYIGSPGGGVWKTTDAAGSWTPLFDEEPTLSVGDIAIDPKHTDVVYVSTSDAFGYGVPFWGGTYSVGVRKSTDGGRTWTQTGLKWTVSQNRTIRRLVIDPTNSDILLAATSNGLYRTDDAGANWKQLWSTSTYDVEFQQNNGEIAYATTDQVLKSTNAGASFTALTASCSGTRYNIKIARSNPDVLYALCTTGVLQKSTDAGHTWTVMPSSGVYLYGYYDDVLAVSPVDDKIVFVAGFDIEKSTDGGTTWSSVNPIGHVDNHCIEFFPGSKSELLFGNDGGIFRTPDAGNTWASLNKGLAITQFYSAGSNKNGTLIVVAGAQDNGNMKYNSGGFTNVTGADGMDDFVDWNNDNNLYCSTQYGDLQRSTNGGTSFTDISTPAGGSWTTPWCQDPKTANTLYAATDKVYKSTNQGSNWSAISGILAGVGTFTVLAVANKDPKVMFAGSGTVLYHTTTGGISWTDVSAGLPVATNYLTRVAINDRNPEFAYATFSGYVAGEKVYKTVDGGKHWTNISGSLPNMPVNCIAYENTEDDALYIGTDAGVYYRNNSLNNWIPYKNNLPNVIVDDLTIHYGTKQIIGATYGRGIWRAPLR
jgi:xyloglucan-specific exo-beta-1,4-glucanase